MAENYSLPAMLKRHSKMPVKHTSKEVKSNRVFGQRRKPAKMFCAGLYARVSTLDQQTLPMQIRALRDYANKRGWTVAMQVKEVGSGAIAREQRQQLIEAARRREIDVVLVWRLDRWGRIIDGHGSHTARTQRSQRRLCFTH